MVTLVSTEEGGRKTAISKGYRPNHVFAYDAHGKVKETFIGDLVFDGVIEPGETKEVTVRFVPFPKLKEQLTEEVEWFLHEGPRLIGKAKALK